MDIQLSMTFILHIDMDAFFAAVEQRDDPRLLGKPVIIGADPQGGKGRGVVSTCSYEARKFGVHSAMPISQAFKKCPKGFFLQPDMDKYSRVSAEIMKILYDFTPEIEQVSVDEAFLDITGSYHLWKTPLAVGQSIKARIKKDLDLNCSIGIASNKMIAKIASDYCKPNGLLQINAEQILEFLWPLTVDKIWGVGAKTKEILNNSGIFTVGDMAHTSRELLRSRLGEHGLDLYELANGIDDRGVVLEHDVKSVSNEYTFDEDTNNKEELYKTISYLCEKVSYRLRQDELKGKTITVKIRTGAFKTVTRSRTLDDRTNFFDDIYKNSKQLFDEYFGSLPSKEVVRLIGVRVANFEENFVQDSLFEPALDIKKEKVHQVMDKIKNKFGEGVIGRGR
ncbi:MAG: DNA polymerase IV [Candidatus Omnitrophica bacterium]|nr:DNA polymerase IV [Candidatus Omnitrophota bacterium]